MDKQSEGLDLGWFPAGYLPFFLYLKYIGKSESFREFLRGTKAMFPKPVGDRVAIARLCFAEISTSKVGKQTTFKQYKQTNNRRITFMVKQMFGEIFSFS